MSRSVRYAWRLLVVGVVIAAIIGLGYLWRSSSAAGLVADGGRDRLPAGATVPVDGGGFDRFRNTSAFSLSNIDDLVQTMVIGVVVLAGVVGIDKARRRRKPIRPTSG